jgi:hypothetical protein
VVVQVVSEVLDVADGGFRNGRVGEMTREQDEGDITNIFGLGQVREVAEFQRGVTSCVQDLWCALDVRETSGVNEFLRNRLAIGPGIEVMRSIPGGRLCQRSCPFLP